MSKEVEYIPITDLLTDIIDNRGKSVPTVERGFPLIATNCIKHSSIYPTFDKVRYVSENTLKTWFRAHIKPNDILFVNKGTPGRVCLVPNPVTFCAAQDMMAFRSDPEKINYKYLFAVLRSNEIQKKIENNHVGLVIPHFRKQELSSLLIPIKSKQEQKAIGELYILLSEKIELNNRINAELEAMAKTLYDYWFLQFDFPDKNGKPYKTSGGKMVWNEALKREVPDLEGWSVASLSNAVNIYDSKRIPLSNMERENKKGKYPYYGATSVMDYIDDYIFDGEYILLAEDGSVMDEKGLPIVQFIWGKTWVNNHAHVLQPKIQSNNEFLFHLLKSISVVQIMTGSIQKKINQENLMNVKVIYPANETLDRFSKFATPIRKQLMTIYEENNKLTELRDWLLPMLMNGQVKVMGEKETELSMAAEPAATYKKSRT